MIQAKNNEKPITSHAYRFNEWSHYVSLYHRIQISYTIQFTDNPYKDGMYVHHTKNNRYGLLTIHIRLVCTYIHHTKNRRMCRSVEVCNSIMTWSSSLCFGLVMCMQYYRCIDYHNIIFHIMIMI